LNAVRAFEAAARHLSFTRAANELHVTQAAISHQVKALEEHLGVRLFKRLNRSLLLTDAAQTYYPAVRDALDSLASGTARIRAQEANAPLNVTTIPSFAAKWLMPRLGRFHDQHPEIDLHISAVERTIDFMREPMDVGIRFGMGLWPALHAEKVADEAVMPVCSPSLASKLSDPQSLCDVPLLHDEMLKADDMSTLEGFPTWGAWLMAFDVNGVDPKRGQRFSHTHLMIQAAIDGQGVALGCAVLVADDVAAGRLAVPFPGSLPTGYSYSLVCLPGAVAWPRVQAFWRWLKAEMSAIPLPGHC
jgi:LysR family glycine cleavage system transcriptional activator